LRNLLILICFLICSIYFLGNLISASGPFVHTASFSLFAATTEESKHFIVIGSGVSSGDCEGKNVKKCERSIGKDSEKHPLRCCSELPKTNWINKKCPKIWAKSFCTEVPWKVAKAKCRSAGARLCAKTEVERGCTGNSGCGFDHKFVWTSDVAEDGGHHLVRGIGIYGDLCVDPAGNCATRAVSNNEIYGARCCADKFVSGFHKEECPGLWGVWTRNKALSEQCVSLTWSAANSHCKKLGTRLCTKQELENGCAKGGTGCKFDKQMLWTSSSESGQDCRPYPHSLGYLATVLKFNSQTWFGAYKAAGWNVHVVQVGSKFGAWSKGAHPLQTVIGYEVFITMKNVEPALANFKDPIYVVDKEVLPYTGRAVMEFIGWKNLDLLAIDSKGDADTLFSFIKVVQPNFIMIDMFRISDDEILLIEETFDKYEYDYIPKGELYFAQKRKSAFYGPGCENVKI